MIVIEFENVSKSYEKDKPVIKNLDLKVIDETVNISDAKSFEMGKLVAKKNGLLLGVSSGANIAAAYEIAKKLGKGKKVLTISSDSGEKYLSTDLFK